MDKSVTKLIHPETDPAGTPEVTVERNAHELELGAWYWVKDVASWDDEENGRKRGEAYEWFGCAMQIGSNYVEIRSPGNSFTRVHFDSYWTTLRRETDPEAVIAARVEHWREKAKHLIEEIRSVSHRLGLAKTPAIAGASTASGQSTGSALVTLSGQADLNAYKAQLTIAKEQTLPALHEGLKKANERLSEWVQASVLSLEASIVPLRESIDSINDRLFSFGLYAGLTESAVQCCEGSPAGHDEPLHVMQRRLYMDEEALLSYEAGGMDFSGVAEFDAWLCRPENRDRILPFPRTLVAMRVRRNAKERETHGDPLATFISIQESQADKLTFLYVRNGEQVWRISCEMDFGPMIFPDGAIYRAGEPMMVRMFATSVDKLITRAEYDQHLAAYREQKARSSAWKRANPDEDPFSNPYRTGASDDGIYIKDFGTFRPREWEPFDRSNVHFDEVMKTIEAQIKEHNRVAVIIQGLFDRSEILHPHPVVQTWRPESFARSVKLVYDASHALNHGEKPDFEAFRAELNRSLGVGSVVVGQEHFWMAREAEKENARRDRDGRTGAPRYRYDLYAPVGDPGPGRVATIENWKPRARAATFSWERKSGRRHGTPVHQRLSVPATALLNISAYTPGDFKRFFADPRTRAEYLQWAPLLLTAEDWHSGKLQTGEPRNIGGVR
ncbi:hypothetical protein [Paraburkholderia sp. SIMBA_054]|uniref:hypothetical protein n=1 Tax=Paraburkholderia sp. SIMBA_054 TaxID=3085795 RepID=UPI00397DC20B